MNLRQDQLPWSEQIWAKINADVAQALAQSRRVRAPFEVFHVPPETQTVMADAFDPIYGQRFVETTTTPIVELYTPFSIRPSQAYSEGGNFYSLDRIIQAAYLLGEAEDSLLIDPANPLPPGVGVSRVPQPYWNRLDFDIRRHTRTPRDIAPVYMTYNRRNGPTRNPPGLVVFNAVVEARNRLRNAGRYEPYALIVDNRLEGEISSTVPGSNSLNTPIERLRPLVTGGIHTTPTFPQNPTPNVGEMCGLVVSVARSWVDIAQAMEPSIQYLNTGANGDYELRLVERFAFRLKDTLARCSIRLTYTP